MSKLTSLAVAAALMLPVSTGAALADGTSGFSAANAAMQRGYTASPGQIFIQTAPHGDPAITAPVTTQGRPTPARDR